MVLQAFHPAGSFSHINSKSIRNKLLVSEYLTFDTSSSVFFIFEIFSCVLCSFTFNFTIFYLSITEKCYWLSMFIYHIPPYNLCLRFQYRRVTLFDMGRGHDGPPKCFDHCDEMLWSWKLKLCYF